MTEIRHVSVLDFCLLLIMRESCVIEVIVCLFNVAISTLDMLDD